MANLGDKGFRIGISTTPLDRFGDDRPLDGIGVYTRSLWDEYQKAGLSPKGYSFPPTKPHSPFETLPSSFSVMALKGLLPWSRPTPMPVDVFHVTNYGSVPMDCAVVTTLFDAIPFVDPAMANPRLRQLKNFILRRSAEHADHVIAISNYAIPELVEHYRVPESKITVVYCGVDNDWIDHQPTQDRVDEVLTHHQLERGYFLTVGTLQPRKNVERLLEAHSRLPERKERPLVVVGKRGWNCEALVAKLEEKIALGEARWLSDVTSRDDLKCLYAGAEAFLFPSLFEGFGLPILEAFAMGLPVLTSNTTSLPEVSQGIGIEIDPLNLDQMVEGMQQLLNLRDREARIQAGRARAMDLTWNRCALETLEVYRKVLAAR